MGQPSDLQQEAFEMVRRWWQAWVSKDLTAVGHMLDPRYVETSERGRLRPVSAAQLLEEAARYCSDCLIADWDVFDPVVKFYGERVVVSYAFRLAGKRGARAFTFTGRATDVFFHSPGRWSLLSHHGSLTKSEAIVDG